MQMRSLGQSVAVRLGRFSCVLVFEVRCSSNGALFLVPAFFGSAYAHVRSPVGPPFLAKESHTINLPTSTHGLRQGARLTQLQTLS